ncbi:hypothetical protein U9M48_044691 [Paspalum notatum var. saurae]|uniref:Prefoldin subunit 2 n=1 Tax=Paspalum notatum var. saurae TaxID=547442 RepID=A0AAQ3XII3_PASNO
MQQASRAPVLGVDLGLPSRLGSPASPRPLAATERRRHRPPPPQAASSNDGNRCSTSNFSPQSPPPPHSIPFSLLGSWFQRRLQVVLLSTAGRAERLQLFIVRRVSIRLNFCDILLRAYLHYKENVKQSYREAINEQVIANTYANMRTEMNQLYTKITELEMEVNEHSLVIGAIEPLDPSRRCYRMIGGVKDHQGAVKRNKEGLEEVIARMHEALERKKKEITDFEIKYKIRIQKADNDAEEEGVKKEGTAQGVLVGSAGHV